MAQRIVMAVAGAVLVCTAHVQASGPLGIYAVIERVVFEPDRERPDRIQIWGAFVYADGTTAADLSGVSKPVRGYLYFSLPTLPNRRLADETAIVRREWADLGAVAGTGEAVGFGRWGYIGAFEGLDPAGRGRAIPYVLERGPGGGQASGLRVRSASERPAAPTPYETNAGIVKLAADGSHADIVRRLRASLAAKP